jgi:hypothetical protein
VGVFFFVVVVLPVAMMVFTAAIAAAFRGKAASNAACVRSRQMEELVVLESIDVLLSKMAGE